jgi:hypothetical protein
MTVPLFKTSSRSNVSPVAPLALGDSNAVETPTLCAGFPSNWKQNIVKHDNACQTTPQTFADVGLQSHEALVDVQIQTDRDATVAIKVASMPSESGKVEDLCRFLKQAEKMVSAALLANLKSRAFHGYDVDRGDAGVGDDKGSREEDALLFQLVHADNAMPTSVEQILSVTDISWNNSAAVLAGSYGRLDHQDWCTHHGKVCIWNLGVREKVNERKANIYIEAEVWSRMYLLDDGDTEQPIGPFAIPPSPRVASWLLPTIR